MRSIQSLALTIPTRVIEAGLLFVLPLVFSRSYAEQFTYPKRLLSQVLVLLGLTFWALVLLWRGNKAWAPHRAFLVAGSLLLLAAATSSLKSPSPLFSLQEASYLLCGPAWAFLLLAWSRGNRDVARLSQMIVLSATVVAVIALLQWFGHDPLLFGGYRVEWGTLVSRMRLYSTFGNPNFYSGYLIGTVFPALALSATAEKVSIRVIWFACAAVMAAAILGGGSRGAWIGLAAGLLAAYIVYSSRRATDAGKVIAARSANRMRQFLLTAAVLSVPLLILSSPFMPELLGRLIGRVYLWRFSLPMFLMHPFTGSGLGTYPLLALNLQADFLARHGEWTRYWTNNRQLHNDLLQLLLETGLLGLAAICALLWFFVRELWKVHRDASPSVRFWLAASAGGVTAMLIDSIFNFQLAIPPTLILIFTLLAFPSCMADWSLGEAMPIAATHNSESAMTHGRGAMTGKVLVTFIVLVGSGTLLFALYRQARAEEFYLDARMAEDRGDIQQAEKEYRQGLTLNSYHGRLHFGLARVSFERGDSAEALREVLLAERTYADSHTWVLKGHIQKDLGLLKEARSTFRHAMELDPTLKSVPGEIEELDFLLDEAR